RPMDLPPGQALVWDRRSDRPPFVLSIAPSRTERRRHTRKYAEGALPPDRSFYFRGPAERLNLRAQNLVMFLQLAEGVDDETWDYHLRRGDYSEWVAGSIKDEELAAEIEAVEREAALPPQESRRRIRKAID